MGVELLAPQTFSELPLAFYRGLQETMFNCSSHFFSVACFGQAYILSVKLACQKQHIGTVGAVSAFCLCPHSVLRHSKERQGKARHL